MGSIVLLDELTINKIAAGEVVERPASVIKEMVENSIDAGATNICIEIKNGGISYIRITDNGKGIAEDDMIIAFERHATSKIRQASDLDEIRSMGFRGEALASIAAVANVEMISKTRDSQIGTRVVIEAGNVLEKEEIGAANGTTITVRNLFFNTPVRYKFLKKDYTESGYIEDAITRLALINPDISFKLINSGKTVIQTNGDGNIVNIIYSIYGKDIAKAILKIDYTYEDIHITGVCGKPEIARSNRSNQMFFINKRYVKDKILSGAVEKAFKGLLPIGKYGFVIINLDMPPIDVDVNVHPAKLEVRFQDENKIFKAVYHAIQDTLLKSELVENVNKEKNETNNTQNNAIEEKQQMQEIQEIQNMQNTNRMTGLFKNFSALHFRKGENELKQNSSNNVIEDIYINKKNNKEEAILEQNKTIEMQQANENNNDNIEETKNVKIPKEDEQETIEIDNKTLIPENEKVEVEENAKQTIENEKIDEETTAATILTQMLKDKIEKKEENFGTMYKQVFGAELRQEVKEQKTEENNADDIINSNITLFEDNEEYNKIPYKFIGIAFKTYIIFEIDNELYILDQHAAHERIMYEKVKENYYSDDKKDSQLLLIPDVITLTHKEMNIAKDNMDKFEKAGFVLEEFGENTFKLTGVPNICLELDNKELFLETLDEINSVARTAKQEIEERFIATIACKAAVKANMALTKEEVDSLMNKLLKLPNPFTCPHGRPTAIKMTKTDIEKKFARRK